MSDQDQDPWGSRKDEAPPDLDQSFKDLQEKLQNIFGDAPKPKPPLVRTGSFQMVVNIVSLVAAVMVLLDGFGLWDLI